MGGCAWFSGSLIPSDLRVRCCRSSRPLSVNWEDLGQTRFLSINISVWSSCRSDGKERSKQSTGECLSSAGGTVLSTVPCVPTTTQELNLGKAGLRFLVTVAIIEVGGVLAKEGLPVMVSLGPTGCRNHFLDGLGSPSFSEVTCLESVLRNRLFSLHQMPVLTGRSVKICSRFSCYAGISMAKVFFYFKPATEPVIPRWKT